MVTYEKESDMSMSKKMASQAKAPLGQVVNPEKRVEFTRRETQPPGPSRMAPRPVALEGSKAWRDQLRRRGRSDLPTGDINYVREDR